MTGALREFTSAVAEGRPGAACGRRDTEELGHCRLVLPTGETGTEIVVRLAESKSRRRGLFLHLRYPSPFSSGLRRVCSRRASTCGVSRPRSS